MKKILSLGFMFILFFSFITMAYAAQQNVLLNMVSDKGNVKMTDGSNTTTYSLTLGDLHTYTLSSGKLINRIYLSLGCFSTASGQFPIVTVKLYNSSNTLVYTTSRTASGCSTTFDSAISVPDVKKATIVSSSTYVNVNELQLYVDVDLTPPSVPTDLNGISKVNSVDLTWTASTDNISLNGYNVYKNGVKVNTEPITTTSYTVTGLPPDVNYSFQVSAVDTSNNESNLSQPAITLYAWSPVQNSVLSAENIKPDSLRLRWNQTGIQYDIYKDSLKIATTSNLYHDVTLLTPDTIYDFHIVNIDKYGQTGLSNTLSVTTSKPIPKIPQLKVTDLSYNSFKGSWYFDPYADFFDVFLNDVKLATITETFYQFTSLSPETLYTFKIVAVGTGGTTEASGSAVTLEFPVPKVTGATVNPIPNEPTKKNLSYTASPEVTAVKVYMDGTLIGEYPVSTNPIQLDFSTILDGQIFSNLKIEPVDSNGQSFELSVLTKSSGSQDVDNLLVLIMNLIPLLKKAFWYIAIASLPLIIAVIIYFWIRRKYKRTFGESKKESASLLNQPSKPMQENVDFKEEKRKYVPWSQMTAEQKNEWRQFKGLPAVNYKDKAILNSSGFTIKSKVEKLIPVGSFGMGGIKIKQDITYERNGVDYKKRYVRGKGQIYQPVGLKNQVKHVSNQFKAVKGAFTGSNKKTFR